MDSLGEKAIKNKSIIHLIVICLLIESCTISNFDVMSAGQRKVDIVYQSLQCGRTAPSINVRWLDNKNEWREYFLSLKKNVVGDQISEPPLVDFSNSGLLVIEMGHKPTSGYFISLSNNHVEITDGEAIIKTYWRIPERNKITAQVITSPCLIIKMHYGPYDMVRIENQLGETVSTVNVK